ncbi:MAG: hypothetical protein U0791_06255 [Gemmataceae bacterium]
MTAQATMINGRPQRKQLSDQLDRLDSIIDGLCDGLPEAIAAAAREGTRSAVKDAILEVMTNPDLRAMIQNLAPAPAVAPIVQPIASDPPQPSLWSRIKAKAAAARTAVVDRYRAAKEAVTTTSQMLSTLMPLRRILLVALGVGVGITVLGFIAPAGVAAVLAGIGGVVTAAVAQVGSWFRRSLRGSPANCST